MRADAGERILDAAAALLAVHGYAATTTRAIAREADVNEVTLFRRFGSKAGVLRALGERMARRQAGRASPMEVAGLGAREALERLARMEIAGALEFGGLGLRLAFDARSVPEVAAVLGDAVPANLDGLTAFLAARQEAGELRRDVEARLMAEAFFSLTSSFAMVRTVLGVADASVDVESDAGVAQLVDLFWCGVGERGR